MLNTISCHYSGDIVENEEYWELVHETEGIWPTVLGFLLIFTIGGGLIWGIYVGSQWVWNKF